MKFSPELAEIRFGCGLSPKIAPPESVDAMLAGLTGPDEMAQRFEIPQLGQFLSRMQEYRDARKAARKARNTESGPALEREETRLKHELRQSELRFMGQILLRQTWTETGLRERLAVFWADHFSALGKNIFWRPATAPYVEEAIRPYLSGRFSDMITAVISSPLMLHYLDQQRSAGPNSTSVQNPKSRVGLNENLARELLELHTLGVDGPYGQQDVGELAELLTGLSFDLQKGFFFRPEFVEPGVQTVLGTHYPDRATDPNRLRTLAENLALHPSTGRHLAHKLAVHFVSDEPDTALVDHIAARYSETGGDLLATYSAMLEHPAAWEPELRNVKPPAEFVGSACRALQVHPLTIQKMSVRHLRSRLAIPLRMMGQPWMRPNGPDGWPEVDSDWITPQSLAVRIRWAMSAPRKLQTRLPLPIEFAEAALGGLLTEHVRFAANSAETRPEAIGLVLASPTFQRR